MLSNQRQADTSLSKTGTIVADYIVRFSIFLTLTRPLYSPPRGPELSAKAIYKYSKLKITFVVVRLAIYTYIHICAWLLFFLSKQKKKSNKTAAINGWAICKQQMASATRFVLNPSRAKGDIQCTKPKAKPSPKPKIPKRAEDWELKNRRWYGSMFY